MIWLLRVVFSVSASVYIKMKKPNAAIRDANAALEVCMYIFIYIVVCLRLNVCTCLKDKCLNRNCVNCKPCVDLFDM